MARGQLQVAAVNNIPTGPHRTSLNVDGFVCNPIPELTDQAIAVTTIEFHLIYRLTQQALFLSLSCALALPETP
jgi:hypothetical protein